MREYSIEELRELKKQGGKPWYKYIATTMQAVADGENVVVEYLATPKDGAPFWCPSMIPFDWSSHIYRIQPKEKEPAPKPLQIDDFKVGDWWYSAKTFLLRKVILVDKVTDCIVLSDMMDHRVPGIAMNIDQANKAGIVKQELHKPLTEKDVKVGHVLTDGKQDYKVTEVATLYRLVSNLNQHLMWSIGYINDRGLRIKEDS